MDFPDWLVSDRLFANLVGILVVLGTILVGALVLRQLLKHGGDHFARWTGLHWLDDLSQEASLGARRLLLRSTVAVMAAAVVGMALYHGTGHDVRGEVRDVSDGMTGVRLLRWGLAGGKLVALLVGVRLAVRLIRRARPFLEEQVRGRLPHPVPRDVDPATVSPAEQLAAEREVDYDATVRRAFTLLERSALGAVVLAGLWAAGRAVEVGLVDVWAGRLVAVLVIVTAARLLTLSCQLLSHRLAHVGERTWGQDQFQRYWDGLTRLFPFGERCFEAAVYIAAASLCVEALGFIPLVALYGARVVGCIALFFCTRVLIELLSVFINQAFGMYEEGRPIDQKGLTLVPLLQSLCQYALYFGSALMMLEVLGINTMPILAGASILGLAGGLGAQSLVTDVVSGFFILFENQYLVGDIVQVGDAAGRVEAVSIRHTQIRDEHGKLYIIPNGQIKAVVNYSKGYANAVVDVKVPISVSLDQMTRDMTEAGRRLKRQRREVLGDTVIKGLVDLSTSDMVVRAVTKVQPGTHQVMQQEFRRHLKEVFEQWESQARTPAA